MHARFTQSALVATAGAFTVVASQAFASGVTAWLAFSTGALVLVLSIVPALFGTRGPALALDGLLAVLGAWTVVASLVFAGATVTWLTFAEGTAVAALGLVGLALDHVVLSRSVPTARSDQQERTAGSSRPAPLAA